MTLQVVMMIVVFQGRPALKLLAHISAASKENVIIYILQILAETCFGFEL